MRPPGQRRRSGRRSAGCSRGIERGGQVGQAAAVGQGEVRVELEQREQDEAALGQPRVGEREPGPLHAPPSQSSRSQSMARGP